MPRRLRRALLPVVLLLPAIARAQPSDKPPDARRAELQAAYADAMAAATTGPADVPLADHATLRLPLATAYVPQPQAGRLTRALGNPRGERLLGIVLPTDPAEWLVELAWRPIGHVADDAALDPEALLAALRAATEAMNPARAARHLPALQVAGWLVPPAYDRAGHRLTWATLLRLPSAPGTAQPDATLHADILARAGVLSLDLTASAAQLPADRPIADALLTGLRLREDRSYGAFTPGTDQVSDVTLTGLLGVATPPAQAPPEGEAFWLDYGPAIALVLVALAAIAATRRLRRRHPWGG